ncbi:MAG: hypothetical protein H0U44_10960 [Flavisolibacter sp.]|nr:hypothetical protein [Flavisolibacter sp.]
MNDKEKYEKGKDNHEDAILPPDEETLHTTDPQENMEGPVSSTVKGIGDAFGTGKSKKEADEEKERKM